MPPLFRQGRELRTNTGLIAVDNGAASILRFLQLVRNQRLDLILNLNSKLKLAVRPLKHPGDLSAGGERGALGFEQAGAGGMIGG